jgi:hypothetical protein
VTLHNASAVFHPVLTSAAFTVAVLVLLGVLFTLAHLHDVRRDQAEEDA